MIYRSFCPIRDEVVYVIGDNNKILLECFVAGRKPDGHLADGQLGERTLDRTDIWPNAQLAEKLMIELPTVTFFLYFHCHNLFLQVCVSLHTPFITYLHI